MDMVTEQAVAEVKRVNYFNGLFLDEADFIQDQNYHIRLRRLQHGYFHSPGIIWGLEVGWDGQKRQLTVAPGMALDNFTRDGERLGRELVVGGVLDYPVAELQSTGVYYVYLHYHEAPSDPDEEKGHGQPIRLWERAEIRLDQVLLADPAEILLAKVTFRTDATPEIDLSVRSFAGFRLPVSGPDSEPGQAPGIRGYKAGREIEIKVDGNLEVGGYLRPSWGNDASKGIAFPGDPGGGLYDRAWIRYYPRTGEDCTLEIGTGDNQADHILLNPSGKVKVGTAVHHTTMEVNGDLKVTGQIVGAVPVGSIMIWPGQSRLPQGWSACNGSELNKNNYVELFKLIGQTYGGSGERFMLPRIDFVGTGGQGMEHIIYIIKVR